MDSQYTDPTLVDHLAHAQEEKYYPLGTLERHRNDRLRQEIRRAILEKRHNEALAEECTFTPQVLHAASSSTSTTAAASTEQPHNHSSGGYNVSRDTGASTSNRTYRSHVFDRLSEQGEMQRRKHEERVAAKERMEAEQFGRAFKPAINTRSQQPVLSQNMEHIPVEERLLHYGAVKALSHEEQRAQKEREEEAGWRKQKENYLAEVKQFQIHKRQYEENKKAFEERNESLMRERARKQIEAELHFHETASFKPTVCPTSAALDFARKDKDGFAAAFPTSKERGELLYYQNMAKEERKASQAQQAPKEVRAPVTNPTSENWIQNSDHRYLFERDFVTRQEVYQQARTKMQVLEEQQREEEERRLRSAPSVQPVEKLAERLYYKPKQTQEEKQLHRREKQEMEERQSCTFAPQLAPGTKHVLDKLQKREPNVVKRLAVAAAAEGEKKKENADGPSSTERKRSDGSATGLFRDDTNRLKDTSASAPQKKTTRWVSSCALAKPQKMSPSPSKPVPEKTTDNAEITTAKTQPPKRITTEKMEKFYERQMETISARERFVDDARKMELLQESAACTFQPQTNTVSASPAYDSGASPQSSQSDVCRAEPVVLGVNEYLRRQAAARRLKEEKEECLRNMGRCRSARPMRGFTTIEPFHFQTEEMSARKMHRVKSFT